VSVTNIAQGGNQIIQLLGLKDVQARLKTIQDACARDDAGQVTADAAAIVEDEITRQAEAQNVPRQALEDIYIYVRRPPGEGPDLVTSLAGLRKKGRASNAHGYVTWYASSQVGSFDKSSRTRRKGKVLRIRGTKIGENLATMWEFGTTKSPAKPFFRPAIAAVRASVLNVLASGYQAILDKYSA